jgi:type IV fimbrial biogenesis protein FimT
MRFVTFHTKVGRQAGLTLVELMVALAIAAVLLMTAAPSFSDYIQNSRLRESGNTVYVQTLLAQSEAIKRNSTVRLSTNGAVIQVLDQSDPANPVLLREHRTADGVSTGSAATIDFGPEGRPTDLADHSVDLSISGASCSSQIRCPGLRVDAGGGVRLCNDHTSTC